MASGKSGNTACTLRAPLDARLMVLTGDHGLGARRVQAVLPALPEATTVVLEDYAGLTWADLAADRGERIDTAMREFWRAVAGSPPERQSAQSAAPA